jgi:hypothetical protein
MQVEAEAIRAEWLLKAKTAVAFSMRSCRDASRGSWCCFEA